MFSVITNISNRKTKGPTLMELFTATGKLIFFTTRDVRCVPCHPWCTHRTSLIVKNKISFPVASKNSIKVGPLVFLLKMSVITENIMKRPVFIFTYILNSNRTDVKNPVQHHGLFSPHRFTLISAHLLRSKLNRRTTDSFLKSAYNEL